MSIEETIQRIIDTNTSIIRFGDGEFTGLSGKDIPFFQILSEDFHKKLEESILSINLDNLLICLPETMTNLKAFNKKSQRIWVCNFADNYRTYMKYTTPDYLYGNAFISRPYMIYKDKSRCDIIFEKLLSIFSGKRIVLIEGKFSRSGVGNDLFKNAESVERIICPANNAFMKYEDILQSAFKFPKDRLFLIAIGPTSKPVALELIKKGYWVLDIGHIDSEYDWYLNNSQKKERNPIKHVAEIEDSHIAPCDDKEYLESIRFDLS